MKRSRREGEREVKRDLKPTGTSYSNEGAMTEIGIYLKIEKHEDTTSHFKLKRTDSGWRRKGEGKREERRERLKERRSRRRMGSTTARRNSSLVKGAIIQGIAPGPQTAHKLRAFNFAILTGRSVEC